MAGIKHGVSTLEDIPPAARTEQGAWDEVIAGIWSSVLAPFCGAAPQTFIEIGPGTSCKVALALSRLNFRGDIYIVDVAENAIAAMGPRYRDFCPGSEVTCFKDAMEECLPRLPARPDLLVLSHVIDDMLLYDATRALPQGDKAFEWCAGKAYKLAPTLSFHETVREIEKNPAGLEQSKRRVLALLETMVRNLRPKAMILSQYPSATLAENELGSLNDHTQDIFAAFGKALSPHLWKTEDIQLLLDRNKNYNHAHIGNNILNAANWLIYEDKES